MRKFFKRNKKKGSTESMPDGEDTASSFVVLEDATYPSRQADSFSGKFPSNGSREGSMYTDGGSRVTGTLMGAQSDNSIFDGCYEPPAVTKVRTSGDDRALNGKATSSGTASAVGRGSFFATSTNRAESRGTSPSRQTATSQMRVDASDESEEADEDEDEEDDEDSEENEGNFSDPELGDALISDGEMTDETDSRQSSVDYVPGLGGKTNTYDDVKPQPESLIAPHMLQWQYMAEEGPLALRVCVLLGAIGLIVTSVIAVVLYEHLFTVTDIIIAAIVFIQALLICFMEGRFFCLNPQGFRARVRILIVKHISVLRHVWGRGVLSVFAGILHLAHWWIITTISAAVMIMVGMAAVVSGMHSSNKLDNLRAALDDDTFLRFEFERFDTDKDGALTLGDFASFLASIGLEFDDMYVINAFHSIDIHKRRKINYKQFNDWWYRCKFNSRRNQGKSKSRR